MRPVYYSRSYVARAAGISESSVRHLERRGIVHPARDNTGRRVYTLSDIAAVRAYVDERRDRVRHA